MKNSLTLGLILVFGFCHAQNLIDDFTLSDAGGHPISLAQFASQKGIAIIFSSQECTYDKYYDSRIRELAASYAGRIQFLLINSNPEPAESPEKMAAHDWGQGITYLADKNQIAMEKLSARRTPEVFLLKPGSGKFQVVYQGAIDDNAQVASDARQFYLRMAIENLLSNQKTETAVTRSIGCTIRKK